MKNLAIDQRRGRLYYNPSRGVFHVGQSPPSDIFAPGYLCNMLPVMSLMPDVMYSSSYWAMVELWKRASDLGYYSFAEGGVNS